MTAPHLRPGSDVARLVVRSERGPVAGCEREQRRTEAAQLGPEGFVELRRLAAERQETWSLWQVHAAKPALAGPRHIRRLSRTFRRCPVCCPDGGAGHRRDVQFLAGARDRRGGGLRTSRCPGGDRDRGEPAAAFPPLRRSTPASCPFPAALRQRR